jgi:uncharacterized protein (DUF1697 family)
MPKQIAFLRGINVGNIRIKMPDLKVAFEKLGYRDVKTYLQTGNVVFDSDYPIEEIKAILEAHLSQTFHYEAFVLLYNFELLPGIIANYPFEREEGYHAYVIFVDDQAMLSELTTIATNLNETTKTSNNVLYWKVSRGQSTDSPFAKILAKTKYKAHTTVRNVNTLEKMV